MLIENYDLEVESVPCEPGAEKFAAIVRLLADISPVLPYLNRTLRGAVVIVCLMLAVEACAPVSVPVSTPSVDVAPTVIPAASATLPPLDAEAIAAQLTPVATLSQAAGQLAAILGTTPDVARVRVEAPLVGACAACDRPPVGEPEEGVPVGDVALPLAPASAVWLTVRDVVCHYVYDGQELKPISVRMSSRGAEQ